MDHGVLRRQNMRYYRQIRSVHSVSALHDLLQKIDSNLKKLPTQKDIHICNKKTSETLFLYCEYGELMLFKWLLKFRKEHEMKDPLWSNYLDIACQKNHLHIIKYIISIGGRPSYDHYKIACTFGHVDQAVFYIDYFPSMATILHGFELACEFGQDNVVRRLIERYHIGNYLIREGLITACRFGYDNVMRTLIEKGAPYHTLKPEYKKIIRKDIKHLYRKYYKAIDPYMYPDLNKLTMKYIMHQNLLQVIT